MIDFDAVKRALIVTHNEDDERIRDLIARAERECLQFLDLATLPTETAEPSSESSSEPSSEIESETRVAADVMGGIILMVQADFDGDPLERPAYRRAAEALWTPYRRGLGV